MKEITHKQIRDSIQGFLDEQFQKKADTDLKKLEKLDTAKEPEKVAETNAEITRWREKYQLENWMKDDAMRMAGQLRFGTHISKGIHPDSKGDNVNFKPESSVPEGFVGTHSLSNQPMDANRNAAALPLVAFFETPVSEASDTKIRDLIVADHPALEGVFSQDAENSKQYRQAFKSALAAEITSPSTDELNKQLLWPLPNAISNNAYINVVPLHPSALTSTFLKSVNEARYSEENKQARDNRKKKDVVQAAYISISDLAVVRLGGTKPQNVGWLTSKQGGRNYLLPSLPPIFSTRRNYRLTKTQTTLFMPHLSQCCDSGLKQLYEVFKAPKNVVKVRKGRKDALDFIIAGIFAWAEDIQYNNPPGWSKDYQLAWPEKYWLDRLRATLEGEEEFAKNRAIDDWHQDIAERFARWLNQRLQYKFPKLTSDLGDNEYPEWQREMKDAIKSSLRSGSEVFA